MDLSPAQQLVIDLLGKPEQPVVFEPDVGRVLQADLEAELADLATELGETALWVSKHALANVHGCEAHHVASAHDFTWTVPRVRGIVAHKAIELSVFWRGVPDPVTLVRESVARLADGDGGAADFLAALGPADEAELVAEANDLVAKFLETFPPMKPVWRPVTESRALVELLGGRVVLSGKVDLTLGHAAGTEARKVIIDLKSGMPVVTHREDLRFYALLETLKIGVPPRIVATWYLDAARAQPEPVSIDLLVAASRRAAAGIRKLAELRAGREPQVLPGSTCRWCPLRSSCPDGMVHLATADAM